MVYRVTVGSRCFEVEVDRDYLVRVDGQPTYVRLEQVAGLPVYALGLDGAGYILFLQEGQTGYEVDIGDRNYAVAVEAERPRLCPPRSNGSGDGEGEIVLRAPLPGRLVALPVPLGEGIEAGGVAAVVETMKMQMEIKAPRAGVVEAAYGPAGRTVAQGEELVRIRWAQ